MVHTVYPPAVKIPMKKSRYRVKILYTSHLSPIANFVDPSVANREPVAADRSHSPSSHQKSSDSGMRQIL
jgi:hypothetical protein